MACSTTGYSPSLGERPDGTSVQSLLICLEHVERGYSLNVNSHGPAYSREAPPSNVPTRSPKSTSNCRTTVQAYRPNNRHFKSRPRHLSLVSTDSLSSQHPLILTLNVTTVFNCSNRVQNIRVQSFF